MSRVVAARRDGDSGRDWLLRLSDPVAPTGVAGIWPLIWSGISFERRRAGPRIAGCSLARWLRKPGAVALVQKGVDGDAKK